MFSAISWSLFFHSWHSNLQQLARRIINHRLKRWLFHVHLIYMKCFIHEYEDPVFAQRIWCGIVFFGYLNGRMKCAYSSVGCLRFQFLPTLPENTSEDFRTGASFCNLPATTVLAIPKEVQFQNTHMHSTDTQCMEHIYLDKWSISILKSLSRCWFLKHFFFSPRKIGGRWTQFEDHIFQVGLLQPPTSYWITTNPGVCQPLTFVGMVTSNLGKLGFNS